MNTWIHRLFCAIKNSLQHISHGYYKLLRRHKEIVSVKLPGTVTDMGEFMFKGCENPRHIDLPSQPEHLWGYTFAHSVIKEIVLPDKLISISPFAFKDCKNLRKVFCGKGLKKIHAWAFGGCDNLKEFICSENVEIDPETFKSKVLNT